MAISNFIVPAQQHRPVSSAQIHCCCLPRQNHGLTGAILTQSRTKPDINRSISLGGTRYIFWKKFFSATHLPSLIPHLLSHLNRSRLGNGWNLSVTSRRRRRLRRCCISTWKCWMWTLFWATFQFCHYFAESSGLGVFFRVQCSGFLLGHTTRVALLLLHTHSVNAVLLLEEIFHNVKYVIPLKASAMCTWWRVNEKICSFQGTGPEGTWRGIRRSDGNPLQLKHYHTVFAGWIFLFVFLANTFQLKLYACT